MTDIVERVARAIEPKVWGMIDFAEKGAVALSEVGRTKEAFDTRCIVECYRSVSLAAARAALDASHHSALVEALRRLVECSFPSDATEYAEAMLAKIGDAA